MPIGFLTAAERERLDGFPEQIPEGDLFSYFHLSEADHQVMTKLRAPSTKVAQSAPLLAAGMNERSS